jgi:hypothetical protein
MIGNNEVVTDSLTSPFFLNLFQDTKEFLSNSENIKQLIREGIKKPFDEIEKEISETIGGERTFKYALEQAKQTGNLEYWLQPILDYSFGNDIKVWRQDFNKIMEYLTTTFHSYNKSGNKIDFREMMILKGIEFFEVVWDFSTESYLLKLNCSTDKFSQINLALFSKRFFFTKSSITKGYQLHWMNYLTSQINSKEFKVAEEKIVKTIQTLLLQDVNNNINTIKKAILTPNADWVKLKPEDSSDGFEIHLPLDFWKSPKTIKLLEKQLWDDLEAIQDLRNQYLTTLELKKLSENYQNLIQTNKFQHYLNLIDEGLIESPLSKTITVFHKTVTVTEETYPEVVEEVKEYLYNERYSEFKIIQPFLLFLNPTDIFEEEELKTIFVEGMANLDYIKKSDERYYFERLDLTKVGTPINLKFDSQTQLKGIGLYFDKMVDIFKGIPPSINVNFVMDVSEQSLDNTLEIQTEVYRTEISSKMSYQKQFTELMRIIFGSDTLKEVLVGKSMLQFPTVSTYKYYTKFFDELGVESVCVSPNNEEEDKKVLSNIYSISKERIKPYTEIKGKKVVLLNFSKEIKSESLLEPLRELAAIATEKKKELS